MSKTALVKVGREVSHMPRREIKKKGWLLKWTNFIKGYQQRWFVLAESTLSCYRNDSEAAHTCRGSVNLKDAHILLGDDNTFIISASGSKCFRIKAKNAVHRQKWVTSLELAKAKAIHSLELLGETEESPYEVGRHKNSLVVVKALGDKIETLKNSNELITKQSKVLITQILMHENYLTSVNNNTQSSSTNMVKDSATQLIGIFDTFTSTCFEYFELAQKQMSLWLQLLNNEKQDREQLQSTLKNFSCLMTLLDQAIKEKKIPKPEEMVSVTKFDSNKKAEIAQTSSNLNDEISDIATVSANSYLIVIPKDRKYSFSNKPAIPLYKQLNHDLIALQDETSGSKATMEPNSKSITVIINTDHESSTSVHNAGVIVTDESSLLNQIKNSTVKDNNNTKKRRIRIPDKPKNNMSLWGLVRNSIGKDMSRMAMPINFSEPLSALQRMAEEFIYSYILDRAAQCEDPCEQLAYVSVFMVTSYSSTIDRTAKPFNPICGETYECDRYTDLGWKYISEQVSHHPPISAGHCDGNGWTCWMEYTITCKFRAQYLQIVPVGITHLLFHKSKSHYTWSKVTTVVHNIFVGTPWLDNYGDVNIINHTDKSKSHVTFLPYSSYGSKRVVKGCVLDKSDVVKWVINGTWDKELEISPVKSTSGKKTCPVYNTGERTIIWRIMQPPEGNNMIYNFNYFSCQLNEMEDGVAPTDSRLRPDQRLMEEGKWDEANVIKLQLESKQRASSKQYEEGKDGLNEISNTTLITEPTDCEGSSESKVMNSVTPSNTYKPMWFKKEFEPLLEQVIFIYNRKYWEAKKSQQWEMCPDIFL